MPVLPTGGGAGHQSLGKLLYGKTIMTGTHRKREKGLERGSK